MCGGRQDTMVVDWCDRAVSVVPPTGFSGGGSEHQDGAHVCSRRMSTWTHVRAHTTATKIVIAAGEIVTQTYRGADISWADVIPREDLLKKTGAKTGGSSDRAKKVATKTASEIAAQSAVTAETPASYNVREAFGA